MSKAMNLRSLLPITLTGLILAGLALSNGSQADDDHEQAQVMRASGDIVSLESVLDSLHGIREGRVIEAELEEKHGRYIYELELVDAEGTVWEYYFDARTGELLEHEQDD